MVKKVISERFSHEEIKSLLDYDKDSGQLFWKARGGAYFSKPQYRKTWNTKNAGKRADNLYENKIKRKSPYSCYRVRILGSEYQSHRIIWYWMTATEPPIEIDHIDQNALNNKWNNLRASCRKENSKNIGVRTNNTSGETGVSLHSGGKWRARIVIDGKEHHLGLFETKDAAISARIKARGENEHT